MELRKEDYEEPCCPLDMNNNAQCERIPVMRVLEKLDYYLDRKEFAAAERHLNYWLSEATSSGDVQGQVSVLNEQIGFYRKQGQEAECLAVIPKVMNLIRTSGMEGSITHGTTLVNAATGYKAFARAKEAIPLYRQACEVYENTLREDDARLGGLYNNMALALAELSEYSEAEECYNKAISVMEKQYDPKIAAISSQDCGRLEIAITYLNLTDLITMKYNNLNDSNVSDLSDSKTESSSVATNNTDNESPEDKINDYLEKAMECLNTEGIIRDGYYAFVCEKCAPVFGYYGYFLAEKDLNNRAEEIYNKLKNN